MATLASSRPGATRRRRKERICTPDRIRTGATAVRGQRARPLHNGGFAEMISAFADELCELAYLDSNQD